MPSKPTRPRKARPAPQQERQAMLVALTRAGARMATDAILLHQTVADRLGIHVTDLRCLQRLTETGPVTAGELGQSTGLTTGAITRMLDRLERAGFIRREHDRQDRRRIIVQPVPDRLAEIGPLYAGLASAHTTLLAQYSNDELALFLELFDQLHRMTTQVTAELSKQAGDTTCNPSRSTAQPAPHPHRAPRKQR